MTYFLKPANICWSFEHGNWTSIIDRAFYYYYKFILCSIYFKGNLRDLINFISRSKKGMSIHKVIFLQQLSSGNPIYDKYYQQVCKNISWKTQKYDLLIKMCVRYIISCELITIVWFSNFKIIWLLWFVLYISLVMKYKKTMKIEILIEKYVLNKHVFFVIWVHCTYIL